MPSILQRFESLRSDPQFLQSLKKNRTPFVSVAIRSPAKDLDFCISGDGAPHVSPKHKINISCLTKPIMAATIVNWCDRNNISLDAELAQFGNLADFIPPKVSFAHLLSHTSGLPFNLSKNKSNDFLRAARPCGEYYSYSDLGYSLAAQALSSLSQRPLDGLVADAFMIEGKGPEIESIYPEMPVIAGKRLDFQKFGCGNDFVMSLSDLLNFMKIHLRGDSEGNGTTGIIGKGSGFERFKLSSVRPLYGGTPVENLVWQHLSSGVVGHAGIHKASTTYLFVHPKEQIYGLIYAPGSSSAFVDVLGKVGLLGVGLGVLKTLSSPQVDLGQVLGKTFRNGEFEVSPRAIAGSQSLRLLSRGPSRNSNQTAGRQYEFKQLRPNLYYGKVSGEFLPRGNANTALELMSLGHSVGIRINDVMYI